MDDCWEFSINKKEWKKLESKGDKPSARSVHAGCMFQDYLWVFGGEGAPSGVGHAGAGVHFNDSYLYDTKSDTWLKLQHEHTPSPRGWMVAATIPGGVAIFGGLSDKNERLDEFYICSINQI